MADTGTQLRRLFQDHGMEPRDIRHNDSLDRWEVAVQAEGSDDRFHRDVGEIGSSEPVDYTLDFRTVKTTAVTEIDGAGIPAGTVTVEGTESEYILITIE